MIQQTILSRIDSIIRFFLYLLIFWLPYSPAVIEVSVVAATLLLIIKRILIFRVSRSWRQTLQPPPSALNKSIYFFIFLCVLSVVGSVFLSDSLHGFISKTLEWFLVYFLILEVFTQRRHIYIALGVLLFTATSTAIDSLVQFYITSKDIFLQHVIEPHSRATAGFKTPDSLGGFLTIVTLVAFALPFILTKKIYKICSLGIIFLLLWSLFLTFTRGAELGVVLGFVFFLYVMFNSMKRYNPWPFILILILMAALSYPFIQKHMNSLFVEDRLNSISWRFQIWRDTLTMIKERPIFGHGLNTYMQIFQEYGQSIKASPTYAHNCYLQLAAETGLLGLGCFLFMVFKLFQSTLTLVFLPIFQKDFLKFIALGLLAGLAAFLIHSFFDTNLYSLQLSIYFWYMVGILGSINNLINNPKHKI